MSCDNSAAGDDCSDDDGGSFFSDDNAAAVMMMLMIVLILIVLLMMLILLVMLVGLAVTRVLMMAMAVLAEATNITRPIAADRGGSQRIAATANFHALGGLKERKRSFLLIASGNITTKTTITITTKTIISSGITITANRSSNRTTGRSTGEADQPTFITRSTSRSHPGFLSKRSS